ncbi:MAG: hypothetical protein GWN58_55975 [Anaerolineae bacterium]|nr:hypothetical protein [Anaerolineae bacterium]
MKELENLRWDPSWVSHLGCIKGCLDYLGVNITKGWLYGGTGHAFVINMHDEVCPSGPTAWKSEMLFDLAANLGYFVQGVFGSKHAGDLAELQERAWAFAREAIDQGLPCYGWELEIPEYYVVRGYDDAGYYFSGPGCDEGKGPKPWGELGDTGIGMVEIYRVSPREVAEDPAASAVTVREALSAALEHARNLETWILPGYRSGLAGYEAWIRAVESGSAIRMGMWYNAAVWEECRRYGVEFLEEAKQRLDDGLGSLLDEAIVHYRAVAGQLKAVTELYPPYQAGEGQIEVNDTSRAAVEALKKARDAEAAGLEALERLTTELGED